MANATPDINSILKMLGGESRPMRCCLDGTWTNASGRCHTETGDLDPDPEPSRNPSGSTRTADARGLCTTRPESVPTAAWSVSTGHRLSIPPAVGEREHRFEHDPACQLGHSTAGRCDCKGKGVRSREGGHTLRSAADGLPRPPPGGFQTLPAPQIQEPPRAGIIP